MLEKLIEQVLQITGMEESDVIKLKINGLYIAILSYLNRDDITDEMIPLISLIIAECLEQNIESDLIQSYHEGDLSVTYSKQSPFFGKLDSFKLIRGLN